ncbi:hypothetical protein SAMN06265360_107170 [Haloechinothrix alba]|uniref:Uncharacterized protein n=1 Tax=Haloechinothrix alba TaxID=664784 RepID=A0A238WSI5_9PSEU|nr:hypothetical protein [Haloechinothrix alba]SNR49502.1 hypothetical protein SAMN06265360_107170 [Haloechinothrix alba]
MLLAFTALLRWALAETRSGPVTGPVPGAGAAEVPPPAPLGTPMFGGLMLFVLGLDPLGEIATAVRDARASEDPRAVPGSVPPGPEQPEPPRPDPVWPYGLVFDVLLAAGAIALTIRRLHTPVRSLPRGVRIA